MTELTEDIAHIAPHLSSLIGLLSLTSDWRGLIEVEIEIGTVR
jgi:hypothetical protein